MKNNVLRGIFVVIWLLLIGASYYFFLPVFNPQTIGFWAYLIFIILSLAGLISLNEMLRDNKFIRKNKVQDYPKTVLFLCGIIIGIVVIIGVVNLLCSPLFNAKSYSNRIKVDQSGDFSKDIKPVDFKSLPLLDKDSSEKLGDRVMGQMNDLVSQYYVSDQYTQINYNNDIIRVTPLEYADFIKWIANRKNGVKGYIKVNSVNGEAKLVRMDKGMKYMPSGFFNDNVYRKLRFTYPTTIFGELKFEIDNDGNPYWIAPTLSYTGVEMKTKVTGIVILDPVTGKSKKYTKSKIPSWVDNAYYADLIIEQVDDWGTYKGGFLNSIFGQKNVTKTTDGYNYLAMDDDIYLYTGITSVLADESNLGFILSNLRTGKTMFYSAPGAEEFSAMSSAKGQVQQMNYESTFPLLINLNNKPTYLVSLKDKAGLVKMYGFIDVEDYQKVVVTDSSKGINAAAANYLKNYSEEVNENTLIKTNIVIKSIKDATINGTTYYYIVDEENKKYKLSISLDDKLPFTNVGDTIKIGYYEQKSDIIEVIKMF